MVQELCKTISSITKQYMEVLAASTIFFFQTGVINRLWYDMENGSRVGVLTRFRLSHQLFLKAKKDVNQDLISVFHVHCTETLSNYRKAHKATR